MFHRPEKGFSIDETNSDGESALHLCARRGDAQRVELLVMSGAELTSPGTSGSPGSSGDAQRVELLVMSGAEVTSPGTSCSPGSSGDAQRVELLVMSGANLALHQGPVVHQEPVEMPSVLNCW